MPWVPISDSGIPFTFTGGVSVDIIGSVVSCEGSEFDTSWDISFSGSSYDVRVTSVGDFLIFAPEADAKFWWYDSPAETTKQYQINTSITPENSWEPISFDVLPAYGAIGYEVTPFGSSTKFAFEVQVFVGDSPEPPGEDCCPKNGSRLFKGIASKYRAAQHQPIRARRFQKRHLQIDFNGAMDKGDTITKVTWECYSPWITFMQNACISNDGKRVCVDVTLNYPGIGDVKGTVETTSGTVENYEFSITVTDAPMYPSAQYIPSNGPYQLVVEV